MDADADPRDLPDGYAQPDVFDLLAEPDTHPIGQRDPDGSADAGPDADFTRADADGHRPPGRGANAGPDDACPEPLCDLHPGGPGRHVVTCPRADLDTLRGAYLDALREQRADARDLYWRIARHPDFVGHG